MSPAVRTDLQERGTAWAGATRAVRFDQVAARMDWPDGRRVLIGQDGMSVTVEPTLFALATAGRATLDSRVNPDLVIPRPARDPQEIPQPPAPEKGAKANKVKAPAPPLAGDWSQPSAAPVARGGLLVWQEILFWVLAVLSGLMLLISVMGTADTISNPDDPDNGWGTTVFLYVFTGLLLWPTVVLFRRRKRPRG